MMHGPINLRAKFTYIGKETKFITKLFKNSPVKIRLPLIIQSAESSAIGQPTKKNTQPIGYKSGVYRLACPDCNVKYVGQTGRPSLCDFKNTIVISNTITTNQNSPCTF